MTTDSSAPALGAPARDAAEELERAQAADIFSENCDYVWNALRRLGVPPSDLEDSMHDTFLAVFRQWGGFDRSRPLRPWLFGFALRVASEHRRRARHRFEMSEGQNETADPSPVADELLHLKQREALATRALQSIELSRRAVFIMHELDGATLAQIAEALGIPLGTATSRLRLAREDFVAQVKRLSLRAR
jgi:RNA polymerase sigma-70 factor (ECF subfamily)